MDYRDHLEALKTRNVISAIKAVDFMDGNQRCHVEALLDTPGQGITEWRKRGFQPVWENTTGLIIERSAKSYQEEPERGVWVGDNEDPRASDTYRNLLADSNFSAACEDADHISRLLKNAIVMAQYVDGKGFIFSTLGRHNADVKYNHITGEIESLCYTAGACGLKGGQLYHVWCNESVIDIEVDGETHRKVGEEENTYGVIPVANLYDIRKPRTGFWSKPVWEQLIALNEMINMFHIETRFNSRMAAVGQRITNASIPDGTVFGSDANIELHSNGVDPLYFEYHVPQLQLEPFLNWIDKFSGNVAEQWGVNLRVAGSASADSGFKLIVEEFPTLELRAKRIKQAQQFEREMYKVVQTIGAKKGIKLPENGILYADFSEPHLPVNQIEDWQIAKEKIALGVMTVEDYWRKEDPSLSDDDIAQKKAQTASKLPDFGGVNGN